MILLSRDDIKKVFTMRDAIEADKVAFQLVVEEGKVVSPLRTNIQAPKYDGCFLFMPAYVPDLDVASIKIVDIFPHNIDNGIPSSPAQVLLIDGTTGVVSALLDGTHVTKMRTGAASGAAFDVLAKKDCKIGALIGTGGRLLLSLKQCLLLETLKKLEYLTLTLKELKHLQNRCRKN